MNISARNALTLIALLCFAALAIALVSQHVYDLQPCAWCVLQRVIYLATGLLCLLARWAGRKTQAAAAAVAGLLAAGGIASAWYQYTVAANLFSCEQTFADRFMNGLGLDAAVPWLFGIYASCSDAAVKVLGLEYALWSLLLFAVLLVLALAALFRRRSPRSPY